MSPLKQCTTATWWSHEVQEPMNLCSSRSLLVGTCRLVILEDQSVERMNQKLGFLPFNCVTFR